MPTSQVLPNVVIAGMGRSGTTSIFQYLSEHPSVCASAKKETRFFEYALYGQPSPPLTDLSAHFPHYAGEPVLAEASPGYFSGGTPVATAMHGALGADSRVIVILREPVSRLTSFYNLSISRMQIADATTLEEYVAGCERATNVRESRQESSQIYQGYYGGFYAEPLAEWFEVFGDRLRIEFFENLQKDSARFMMDLSTWLGIDAGFYDGREVEVQNAATGYRRAWIHRLANGVNDRAEFALRRNPQLKTRLRRAYSKVNTQAVRAERPSPELRRHLQVAFADSNRRTREILTEHGHREFPDWLATA